VLKRERTSTCAARRVKTAWSVATSNVSEDNPKRSIPWSWASRLVTSAPFSLLPSIVTSSCMHFFFDEVNFTVKPGLRGARQAEGPCSRRAPLAISHNLYGKFSKTPRFFCVGFFCVSAQIRAQSGHTHTSCFRFPHFDMIFNVYIHFLFLLKCLSVVACKACKACKAKLKVDRTRQSSQSRTIATIRMNAKVIEWHKHPIICRCIYALYMYIYMHHVYAHACIHMYIHVCTYTYKQGMPGGYADELALMVPSTCPPPVAPP